MWGDGNNYQSRRGNLSVGDIGVTLENNYYQKYKRHRLSIDQLEEGNKVRVNDKYMDERIIFIAKFDSTNQMWPDRFNY